MKKAAGKIMAVVSGLLVLISLLIVTPLYALLFLNYKKDRGASAHKLSRIWASYILIVCGVRLHVENRPVGKGPFIFISNHRSMLDIPLCARTTSIFFKFLAKEELAGVPLLGFIIRKLYIVVNRSNMRARYRSYEKMRASLDAGVSVWLFPEGTRNKTEAPVSEFEEGAFHLSINTGVPIRACAIVDTGAIVPTGKGIMLRPGKVKAKWLAPIPAEGNDAKSLAALYKNALESAIRDLRTNGKATLPDN